MAQEASAPSFYSERLKRAAHMLFFKRGKIPGARSWELKAGLGKGFSKVVEQLDEVLRDIDLEVKKVEAPAGDDTLGEEGYRYFVRLRGTLAPKEARMSGWRIDNLAALASCLAVVVSKQGKVERKELEDLVAHKAGRWRSLTLMDTFLRTGYLEEDDDGLLRLGWRTRAELDLQSLMMLVVESKPESQTLEPEQEEGKAVEEADSQAST